MHLIAHTVCDILFLMSHSQLILILEVQSARVRGSLIFTEKKSIPRIVYATEVEFSFHTEKGTPYHVDKTITAVEQVIHHCLRHIHGTEWPSHLPHSIDRVHYVLSSPWIISRAQQISIGFNKDTKITLEKVSSIIANQRNDILPRGDTSFEIIEEKVFDVRLHGYRIEQWHGKKAKQLDISFALSIAGTQTIRRFRDACAHAVESDAISFHSGLLLEHIAISHLVPQIKNYTIIHVHGELTDVVEVKEGTCSVFGSFPLGSNTIVRTIGDELHISTEHADSSLSLYEHGQLDIHHARHIHTAIHRTQHAWSLQLERVLNKDQSLSGLYRTIIIGAHTHETFFTDALTSIPHHGRIEHLDLDMIKTKVHINTIQKTSRSTALYAIAIHSMQ